MDARRRTLTWLGGAVFLLLTTATPTFAAEQPQGEQAGADCPLKAVVATHTLPPYPASSQSAREHGTTRLIVTIDRKGMVTDAAIDKSSGFAALDDAAIDWIKKTWRWQPQANICRATVRSLVDIVWDLQDAPKPGAAPYTLDVEAADFPTNAYAKREEGVVTVDITIGQDGAVTQTRISHGSGFPDLDAKAMEITLRHRFDPGEVDGHAVLTTVRVLVAFRLNGAAPP